MFVRSFLSFSHCYVFCIVLVFYYEVFMLLHFVTSFSLSYIFYDIFYVVLVLLRLLCHFYLMSSFLLANFCLLMSFMYFCLVTFVRSFSPCHVFYFIFALLCLLRSFCLVTFFVLFCRIPSCCVVFTSCFFYSISVLLHLITSFT